MATIHGYFEQNVQKYVEKGHLIVEIVQKKCYISS